MKIREKLEGLTPYEVAGEALLRTRRKVSRTISRLVDNPIDSYGSGKRLSRSLSGQPLAQVAARIRGRAHPRLTPGLADLERCGAIINQHYPDTAARTRAEADAILLHRIRVFGRDFELGERINWSRDPTSGAEWPLDHFTRVPLRPGRGADVRAVWELNRLHQLTTLGRAYVLTKDERYTEEFLAQLAAWSKGNPPGFGVNWTVAMEAAIRAVNLIAATDLFRLSPLMNDDAIEGVIGVILAHGRFIRANLEFSYRTPSNHYLSDLIGLFAIGMVLPDFKESAAWANYSVARLLTELERQVLPDGVDYEGAIGYHRFVLEIFTLFFALCRASGLELPGKSWARLGAMFEFTRAYLKPDGLAPSIGDSDDGRLLRFSERPASDHSYLMSLAAILIQNNAFKRSGKMDEEAVWWFGESGVDAFESLPAGRDQQSSRAFQQGQIFIQRAAIAEPSASPERSGEGGGDSAPGRDSAEPAESIHPVAANQLYAIVDCGDHGARGRGSHAHSDALSLEVYAYGRTILRDPGTFLYTASERWRNRFRSTAYHNTVRIDGQEISRITEGQPFALGPNVKPRVNRWHSAADRDILDAEHGGYEGLAEPVTHRRLVTLDKILGYWIIEDRFTGKGSHQFEFFFNFDAGLHVAVGTAQRVVARGEGVALTVAPISGHGFQPKIANRWVSASFGTRSRSSGIMYRLHSSVPFENVTLLIPYRPGEEAKVEEIIRLQVTGDRLQGGRK